VKAKLASPDAPIRGYLLVFINLGMDAYTNTTQDAITTRFRLTTPQQLMFYMNCWCTLYYTIYMFALPPNLLPAALSFLPAPGAGWEAVAFLRSYPEALRQVLLYCLCGAAGQMFIFMSISNFGSVVNITVTTTRKVRSFAACVHPPSRLLLLLQFFNVLLSVFHKGSALLPAQWAGVIMVFSGLGAQIQMKMSKHAPASKAKKLK
jgi:solute carrier family 35 (UDP-galactose transporter), member B1